MPPPELLSTRPSPGVRVLFLIANYAPAIGGAESQGRRLAEALVSRGCDVEVLTASRPDAPPREEIAGVTVHRKIRVLRRRGFWGATHFLSTLLFLVRRGWRYDALVSFQLQTFHNPAAAWWGRWSARPVVVRGSGTGAEGDVNELVRMPSGRWILASLRKATALVALTGEMREQMGAAGLPPERIVVIPNGVDTTHFRPAPGAPVAGATLLYLGRLIPAKGLPDLMAAFALLAAERRDLRLRICGDGPERDTLAAQAGDLGLADRVLLDGWVDDPRPALTAAAVVALPSHGEGMSNVLLEAMSCGCPIVATDIPANRDLVEEGVSGLLVPPGNPAALAAAIRRLLDEPELAAHLAAGARRRVVDRFSITTVAQRYHELLLGLGAGKRSRAALAAGGIRAGRGGDGCMLIARFHPLGGGTEIQALRLAQALRASGRGIFVVTARVAGLPAADTVGGVPVRRTFAPGPTLLSSFCFCVSSFLLLLRRRSDYDLLHVHLASSHALTAVAVRAILGKPVIVKLGGGRATGDIGTSLRRPWGRWKLKRILRGADRVVAPSREVEDEARAFGFPAARLRRIPNGVDTVAFAPVAPEARRERRARLGIPAEAPVGVFTGRLEPGKGLETLLEAWPRLGGDAHLILVGDGSLRENLSRRHASDRVRFVGAVQDVRPWLHAADLFFLPSAGEGLSNALLEAMSCALVPVVSAIPANREVVADGGNGFVIDCASANDMAPGLRAVLAHRAAWPALGAAARRTVEERYSLTGVCERYRNLYRELLG